MKVSRPSAHVTQLSALLLIFFLSYARAEDKPILAIVEFEGFGISPAEAIGLTNRLRNEIFRKGHYDVVDRGMMKSILGEQDFQLSACTSNECLVEVGQLLGAQQMMGGSITKIGSIYTISARLVDVETGKVIKVSDYDIRGGLEDLLTEGMAQVAIMFSLANLDPEDVRDEERLIVQGEGQTNISEAPITTANNDVNNDSTSRESALAVSETPSADREGNPKREPSQRRLLASQQSWSTSMGGISLGKTGHLRWSFSHKISDSILFPNNNIYSALTFGGLHRTDATRGENHYFGMITVSKDIQTGERFITPAVYSGLGFGNYRYWEGYKSDGRGDKEGKSLIAEFGIQLRYHPLILPSLIADIKVIYTPQFGRSSLIAIGAQGSIGEIIVFTIAVPLVLIGGALIIL